MKSVASCTSGAAALLIAALGSQPVVAVLCAEACGRSAVPAAASHCGGEQPPDEGRRPPCDEKGKICRSFSAALRKAPISSERNFEAISCDLPRIPTATSRQAALRGPFAEAASHSPPARAVLRL